MRHFLLILCLVVVNAAYGQRQWYGFTQASLDVGPANNPVSVMPSLVLGAGFRSWSVGVFAGTVLNPQETTMSGLDLTSTKIHQTGLQLRYLPNTQARIYPLITARIARGWINRRTDWDRVLGQGQWLQFPVGSRPQNSEASDDFVATQIAGGVGLRATKRLLVNLEVGYRHISDWDMTDIPANTLQGAFSCLSVQFQFGQ